jgi:hypothetical protein
MNLPGRFIVLPVLGAACLAACGSSTTTRTAGGQTGSLAAWRAAVQCAREHGMTGLPDPALNADGHVTLPGLSQTPTPTPQVRSACAAEIRAITSSGSTPASVSPADTRALVRVASCMRTHGYSRWPDPDPSESGTFHITSAYAGTPERLGKAIEACHRLIPPDGWHLRITPSGQ